MPQKDMKVVPKPPEGSASVLEPDFAGVVILGKDASSGDMTYRCGSCKTKLIKDVDFKQVLGVVIRCGKCQRYNEIPKAHHMH